MTPNRNEPCTCGSGKKFKKCCINTSKYNQYTFMNRLYDCKRNCTTKLGKRRISDVLSLCCIVGSYKIITKERKLPTPISKKDFETNHVPMDMGVYKTYARQFEYELDNYILRSR